MKLMRIILSILLLLVAMGVLVWVLGVPRQPAAQNVTATTKSSTTQPVLRIGITPERDIIRQRKIFRALGDYLGEKLNYRVELVTASEYRGVLQDLGDKRVDVAMLGSLTTVLSIDRYQARILASPVLDLPVNKFHSVIFVPAQSPVNRMEDLAGRSIVMTRASGGGSLYAVYELFRLGLLNRPDTPRMIWVGTHDDAVVAVAEGRADGGVVKDLRLDDYERMHPEKKMRRLAISDEVPEYALVARAGLADGLEAELRRVVLMMDQDEHGKSALQLLGATRFQPYSVAEYKAMYDMIEGIGPNWELVGIDGPAPNGRSTHELGGSILEPLMLRRKLLMMFGPLVLLLLLTAMVAVWMLQGVLADLRHVKESAWVMVEDINELSVRINSVEVHLYELQTNRSKRLDEVIDDVETCRHLVSRLGENYLNQQPNYRQLLEQIQARLPEFERHVSALATAQDPQLARRHNELALAAAVAIRQDTLPLARIIRDHAQVEQEELLTWFRWLVLGLGLVFLLVINLAVIMLLRTAGMILRPIDRLVEATQELAAGRYDHRVQLDQKDEFDQLARAYNQLAEQLQTDEKQRMEMLGQVSLTMNHEINNAVAIIEMQLRLMRRQTTASPETEKYLKEIHNSLARMTRAVQALKSVRRIVLTDYIEGVKMLDLERSAGNEPAVSTEPPEAGR